MKEKRPFKRFDLFSGLAVLGVLLVLLFESFFIFELYRLDYSKIEPYLPEPVKAWITYTPPEAPAAEPAEEGVPEPVEEPAPVAGEEAPAPAAEDADSEGSPPVEPVEEDPEPIPVG